MKLNYSRLKQKALRLIKSRKSFDTFSNKQWELCPPETFVAPSAIFLDGMLDRVKSVSPWTNIEHEVGRISGGKRNHGGTTAYNISDIILIDGHLYKGELKYSAATAPEAFWIHDHVENIPSAQLASTYFGSYFFGHWMREEVPLMMLDGQFGEVVRVERKPFYHEPGYQEIFHVSSRSVRQAKFDNLVILDDVGQNSLKRKRYEQLRSYVKAIDVIQEPPLGVFIQRGEIGSPRRLLNSDEVAAFLSGIGFRIIDPEKMEPLEILHHMKGAKIAISVEGSGLVHAYNCLEDGGTILAIQPPYRFNNSHKDYADCVGMNYAFVVANVGSDPSEFVVDIGELEKTLEKVHKRY